MRSFRIVVFLTFALALGGCVDLTGRSAAQLMPMQPGQKSPFAREGHVYCILGWLGIWSRGMDIVAQRTTDELGVNAISLGNPEWRKLAAYIAKEYKAGRWSGPLVLVGHSIGCDDQIRVAKLLNNDKVPVDLIVLIDPNLPPLIPPNVKRCVDIFKSHPGTDAVPVFRGIAVKAADPIKTRVENINLRTAKVGFDTTVIDHFNIAKIKGVQDMVLAEIAKTCPLKKR